MKEVAGVIGGLRARQSKRRTAIGVFKPGAEIALVVLAFERLSLGSRILRIEQKVGV